MRQEETTLHTRVLRFQLGDDEARSYWSRVADVEHRDPLRAFEERWFGTVSEKRVRLIMREMQRRYDAFPEALRVLTRWEGMSPATRKVICHWHLQLVDPLYRQFSADYLEERRMNLTASVTRDQVIQWVDQFNDDRWGRKTLTMFASKLLSTAYNAGLVNGKRDPRELLYPRVPDAALSYLLHLLPTVRFEGTLTENPYLQSVGLTGRFLEDRLRTVPGMTLRRMGDLVELQSRSASLEEWADQTPLTEVS